MSRFVLGFTSPRHRFGADARSSLLEASFAPVLVLGGSLQADPVAALKLAADAIQSGARGVVFGRNVFQAPDPERMVAALCEVVHGGASVAQAKRLLER